MSMEEKGDQQGKDLKYAVQTLSHSKNCKCSSAQAKRF